jgi:hypothetical protein
VCVFAVNLSVSLYGGSSGSLAAVNDSVQSLRSALPFRHGGVEGGPSGQFCMAQYKALP